MKFLRAINCLTADVHESSLACFEHTIESTSGNSSCTTEGMLQKATEGVLEAFEN